MHHLDTKAFTIFLFTFFSILALHPTLKFLWLIAIAINCLQIYEAASEGRASLIAWMALLTATMTYVWLSFTS